MFIFCFLLARIWKIREFASKRKIFIPHAIFTRKPVLFYVLTSASIENHARIDMLSRTTREIWG